jgi:hypothetical protein
VLDHAEFASSARIATTSILDTIAHPALFGPWFKRPATWAVWRVFLSALFGLPIGDDDLDQLPDSPGEMRPIDVAHPRDFPFRIFLKYQSNRRIFRRNQNATKQPSGRQRTYFAKRIRLGLSLVIAAARLWQRLDILRDGHDQTSFSIAPLRDRRFRRFDPPQSPHGRFTGADRVLNRVALDVADINLLDEMFLGRPLRRMLCDERFDQRPVLVLVFPRQDRVLRQHAVPKGIKARQLDAGLAA